MLQPTLPADGLMVPKMIDLALLVCSLTKERPEFTKISQFWYFWITSRSYKILRYKKGTDLKLVSNKFSYLRAYIFEVSRISYFGSKTLSKSLTGNCWNEQENGQNGRPNHELEPENF